MPLYISNGSSLVSPQIMESVTNVNAREEQVFRLGGGFSPAAETGSIIAATTTLFGTVDYGHVGNMTVSITTGTAVGVSAVFEASMDGGTNWFPISGQREDNGLPESATGVLPASTTPRTWMFPMAAANRFRVRAVAWTSGSAAVRLQAGPTLVDPVVAAILSNPLSAQVIVLSYTATPTTTDAMYGTVGTLWRGNTSTATQSAYTVPAGKTFRLQSFSVRARATAATALAGNAVLRYSNAAPTVTSPALAYLGTLVTAATIGDSKKDSQAWAQPLDFAAGQQLAASFNASVATGAVETIIQGIEF